MKSMRGYGRATTSADGNQVTVEVSAVNSRKQVDMRFAIPRELGMLEPVLRQQIQDQLSRGSLYVALSYVLNPAARKQMAQVDLDMACHVAANLREVAKKTGINGEITLQDILSVPGLRLLSESPMSGVYAVSDMTGRQIFLTGHSEYDPDTLKEEYLRDLAKGMPIDIPFHYFTDDDPAGAPQVTWRSSAYLIFANWLNYYVYQMTPFNLENLDDVGNAAAESAE